MLSFEYIQSLPYINPNIDRRTVLILGGCSGVGWYTVLHLYLHGYIIYITGRSKSRVIKCIDELKQESINIRLTYTSLEHSQHRVLGELIYLELDLSNLNSVHNVSKTLIRLELNLNILINNLSTNFLPYHKTPDGFELQLQVNYISPFLVIIQLLPLLENTADLFPNIDAPKIIYTSSPVHRFAFKYFDLNSDLKYYPGFIFNVLRYSRAKVLGIHMIKMLALRNPRILSVTIDPGYVMNANFFSSLTRFPIVGIFFWLLYQMFGFLFGSSIEAGACGIIKTCLDPSLDLEDDNGKTFSNDGQETTCSKVANNMDYAARTWIWTLNKLNERNIRIPS